MKVTSKGQVTIPKRVRDRLGIRAGTVLEIEVEGGTTRLRKAGSRDAIERWRGVHVPLQRGFFMNAVAGAADAVVSGDRNLLDLDRPEGIPVLSPAEFLARLE